MQDTTNVSRTTRQLGFYLRRVLLSAEGERLLDEVEKFLPKLADRIQGDETSAKRRARPRPEGGEEKSPKRRPGANEKLARAARAEAARNTLADFAEPPADGPVEENIRFAAAEFQLDALDCEILALALVARSDAQIREFGNEILRHLRSEYHRAIAAFLHADPAEVERRLLPSSALISSGLLAVDTDYDECLFGRYGLLQSPAASGRAMSRRHADRSGWVAALVGEPMKAELAWEDYAHIGKQVTLAERVLLGATAARSAAVGRGEAVERGVNVLLVGQPGLGKTELAKVLADRCGLRLWAAGEADETGEEPGRNERIAAMRTSQSLLRLTPDAALLLDEAEDVLGSRASFGSRRMDVSKLFVNRLLDDNAVPVIWTCNSVAEMDPAALRRMTVVIGMRQPDVATRERIWSRVVCREGLELPEGAVARLSRSWALAAPAVVATAARAARLAGGGEAEIDTALAGVMELLGAGAPPAESDGSHFDPDLVVASEDLGALAGCLARPGAPTNWSLVLHGVPGTGKSEFARHVVGRVGMPLLRRRASDLQSKYVGDTEKLIASLFAEARQRQAATLIDEFEALAFDRGSANQSWELSQVGEFLTWAENHPLPLICSTNLPGRVDAAMLDRFTFKVRLDALDPDRAALAWTRILGGEAPPTDRLPLGLTPRDFHRTRKKGGILGTSDQATLLKWLREEAEARGPVKGKFGF